MSLTYYLDADGITYIPVTEATPLPTGAGGGGATMQDVVDAINAHTVLLTQMATDTNELIQDTSVMVAILNDIKTNTTPAP